MNNPADAFCDSLLEIFASERLILFAGAGVGVHAGLWDWRSFVAHLITVASRWPTLNPLERLSTYPVTRSNSPALSGVSPPPQDELLVGCRHLLGFVQSPVG